MIGRRLVSSRTEEETVSRPLRELSIDERIRLVEDIWDSIAEDEEALEVPESHRAELNARLQAFEINDDPGQDAREVIDRIRTSLG
jgi:putative addiction module component (TIGR02574 family)